MPSKHEKDDSTDFFRSARSFIDNKAAQYGQGIYLLFAAGFFLLLTPFLYYPWFPGLDASNKHFAWGIFFGGVGAMLSVLIRFKNTELPRYAEPIVIGISGVIRIALGATFGIVFVLLQKADFLLGGLTKNNGAAIALFAIVAGMNEKFVPDLLSRAVPAAGDTPDGAKDAAGKAAQAATAAANVANDAANRAKQAAKGV